MPTRAATVATPRRSSGSGRRAWGYAVVFLGCAICVGCPSPNQGDGRLETIWGRRGISDGRLRKPRALAINSDDEIFIVDMTARIQVFNRDGQHLRGWRMPDWENGRPTGISIDRAGNVMVADTHYYRILVFDSMGNRLPERTLGGRRGQRAGEFGLVTDAVEDSQGNVYVAEYGEYDRIQKFAPDGQFLLQWGGHGSESGQFIRPQNLAIDKSDHVWVADACNHRIQVFDATGDHAKLIRSWGQEGSDPGQLRYPYDLVLDGKGHVYVCEFGNHRVQKFTLEGRLVSLWGNVGRQAGQLHNPWAIVQDSRGRIHVLDTYNHRVQRVRL